MLTKKSHSRLEQRYQIQAYLRVGKNQSEISLLIDKDKSAVSRKFKRNRNAKGNYLSSHTHKIAEIRKERLKPNRKPYPRLEKEIRNALMEKQWSLE